MNESELINGCLKNDRKSQKELYEKFYSRMFGICLRYTNNKHDAKDVVHEGFLKVYSNLKFLKTNEALEGWMRRIMTNTAIDNLRKNKQNYRIVSTVYAEEKIIDVQEEVNDEELEIYIDKEIILRAVQNLTPAYRMVFNLYEIEDYTHKQISEMLGISEGTSKSNLSKAKFNLRKNLKHLINK